MRYAALCSPRIFVIGLSCLFLASTAWAEPSIGNVSLRGLQIGGTTTLLVDGNGLAPDPKLVLGLPIASQAVKSGSTAQRLEVDVTLDAATPAGVYQLRVVTPDGISGPVPMVVDRLPQRPLGAEINELPAAYSGSLTGSQTIQAELTGKKGESLVVEVEARRLGSQLNPVVHLYDARGVQLAWAQGTSRLGGDARLQLMLPADGRYKLELHDALYRGQNPGFFRLKVGDLKYADIAFPLAGRRGAKTLVQFASSNLPPDATADVEMPAGSADRPVPLPARADVSGSPRLIASDLEELVEQAAAEGQLQALNSPAAVSGRLVAPGEEDRYSVNVRPGSKLRIEVLAARMGSAVDGVLFVRNPAGSQLATSDDQPETTDPGLDFNVPGDVKSIVVAIKDLQGRGGPDFVYRIAIDEADRPNFTLATDDDRHQVPLGGVKLLRVQANRSNYSGNIRLALTGLPEGIAVSGAEIPAGASQALLTFTASAPAGFGVLSMTGESTDPTIAIAKPVLLPAIDTLAYYPWLRSQVAVAVRPTDPLRVVWADSSAGQSLAIGTKLPVHVTIARDGGVQGQVRLSLVTSQPTPKKKIKENNQDKEVDDVDRMLRFDGMPIIAADKTEADAAIIIPPDLPAIAYDLALQAELLSADGKSVIARAFTPARRMTAASPFRLELAGEPKVEARAGLGDTGKLTGKIVRAGGFQGAVKVTLAGLPQEYSVPSVDVPGDRADFTFPVAFAYGNKPGDLAGVRLVATYQASAGAAAVARSNEIAIAVKVVEGEKPAAEKPLAIFEDQPEFVTNLTQGSGQATLVSDDKYSGSASVRVTPDQRFNPALPGLGLKIRQHPAAGEYRYLRYAWKKKGGAQLCLQLNHDASWGPVAGNPAKFRYHAGPGPECFTGSLALEKELPADWTVVTRDLFADFGEFTLTGIALSPMDGEYALFDHIYLGQSPTDFETLKP